MDEQPELVLNLRADASQIAVARRALARFTRAFGIDDALLGDVLTAVSEACANAIIHGYAEQRSGVVQVRCAYDDPCLELKVRDWGMGMQAQIDDLDAPRLRVGLSMMSAVADQFDVRSGPGFGTEVSLLFDLDREPRRPEPEAAPAFSDEIEMLAAGPAALAALRPALAMYAAEAGFSVDRLADLQLLADLLVESSENVHAAPVRLAVSAIDGGLRIRVGPFPRGRGEEFLAATEVPGLGDPLRSLSSNVAIEPCAQGEHVVVDASAADHAAS